MKGKYTSFLILPSILIAFFIIFSASKATAGLVAPECVANSCGTSVGTKQVPVFETVCEDGCPTVHFEWTEKVYESCPVGYSVNPGHEDECKKNSNPNKNSIIDRPHTHQLHSVNVIYDKSNDPHKCHRPSDSVLQNLYGMDSSDIRNDFKHDNHEWKNSIDVNCQQVFDHYNTVVCNDAPVILCEEQCPTECGYGGGRVPDGDGGYKTCEPTYSCSTHRWCFPDDAETDSPTGYVARAISIDITPQYGKPWESGKMIDQYCSYAPAGECPTVCGYEGGDEVADGKGGTIICQATPVCEKPEVCEYDSELTADDPLCVPEDEGDVLGTTDVVTADTAGGLDSSAYILQFVLVLITSVLFVSVGREYLKK